jgi:hypothetical protein
MNYQQNIIFDGNEKDRILKGYLTEYKECCNSYRHIYTTIWASAAAFFALSAAIITLGVRINNSSLFFVQKIGIIPILFWWIGIFRHMDKYGDSRKDRQKELEEIIQKYFIHINFKHARGFETRGITVTKSVNCFIAIISIYWLGLIMFF